MGNFFWNICHLISPLAVITARTQQSLLIAPIASLDSLNQHDEGTAKKIASTGD
jgi:hypothetical protein